MIAIWRYIADDSPTAATRLVQNLERQYQRLVTFPYLGERQPQFGESTRRLIVGNYLIFYDVLDDAIHILRVYHAARKLEDLFE